MAINQVVKDFGLSEKLEAAFGARNSGLILVECVNESL